jgi:ABC-type multidrug transport system permease subunit
MKTNHLLISTLMEIKRMIQDRRRMLILILGPVGICLIFGFVFHHSPKDIDLALFIDRFPHPAPSVFTDTAKLIEAIDRTDRFAVTRVDSLPDAYWRLSRGQARAVVVIQEGRTRLQAIKVIVDVTDRIVPPLIQIELPQVLNRYAQRAAVEFLSHNGMPLRQALQMVNPFGLELQTNEWKNIKYFDLAASGVMVLFIMGAGLLMSVTAITSERSSGTLERIFASPYKTSEIILSKLMAHTLLGMVVATLVIVSLKLFFHIVLGNVFLLLLVFLFISGNAVALGLLVSAITNTELESVMGGIICWFQAMMLMGFTWPLETMHPVMAWLSRLNPFSYGLNAIKHINLNHWSLNQIWFYLAVLLVAILVQAFLAIRFLRQAVR